MGIMNTLSRADLQRLLGVNLPDERTHVLITDRTEGDLRIRHFRCGRAQIPAVSVAPVNTKLDAIYKRLSRLHQALKCCIETKLTQAPS